MPPRAVTLELGDLCSEPVLSSVRFLQLAEMRPLNCWCNRFWASIRCHRGCSARRGAACTFRCALLAAWALGLGPSGWTFLPMRCRVRCLYSDRDLVDHEVDAIVILIPFAIVILTSTRP